MEVLKVLNANYRRSPLGGIEIQVEGTVELEYANGKKPAMTNFEALTHEHLKEPVEDRFEAATTTVIQELSSDAEESDMDSEYE